MRAAESQLSYQEACIPADLQPFITKMWYSYVGTNHLQEVYLPRPFPFFVVLLKGNVQIEHVDHGKIDSPIISINGTMKETRAILHFQGPIESIGIDLTSHGFFSMFGMSPHHLQGKTVCIGELLPMEESTLVDSINSIKPINEKLLLLLSELKPYFKPTHFDQRINHPSLATMIPQCNYQVNDLADAMCISEKTLNRLCKEFIGTSPKNYINIVRMNEVYAYYKTKPNTTSQEAANKFGFYDVQHLTKTFKHYLGLNLPKFNHTRSDEASSIWAN